MEHDKPAASKWADMPKDILIKIFLLLDVLELSTIAQVCSKWRIAVLDHMFWRTLDLSMLKSNFIKIPIAPYVYVDNLSDNALMRVLKVAMNLSMGSIVTLIFHFNLYITDEQLTYTAERCPKLKRLVMPSWNQIKKSGICKAIRMWPDLESMTLLSVADLPCLLEEISNNCKNFSELKVMGPCDTLFASKLAKFLPGLKVLSLRCSMISKAALNTILEGLPNLEGLNISHSLIIDVPPLPASPKVLMELDQSTLKKAARLRQFFTCIDDKCTMCQHTRADNGLLRWYKYEELWKMDEVKSLAL